MKVSLTRPKLAESCSLMAPHVRSESLGARRSLQWARRVAHSAEAWLEGVVNC